MLIEDAVQARLQSLVTLAQSRVYPLKLPQNKDDFPAVTFFRTSGQRGHPGDGPSGDASPDFQVSCWGKKYSEVKAVANQVRMALDEFAGDMNGVEIHGCECFNEIDMYEEETEVYHTAVFFTIWHEEEVPST